MKKQTRATSISKKVKDIVYTRDLGRCIICGKAPAMPNSHFIKRSQGGLGIEENIATMCQTCHYIYDHGSGWEQILVKELFEIYLKETYPGWNTEKLKYNRWAEFQIN